MRVACLIVLGLLLVCLPDVRAEDPEPAPAEPKLVVAVLAVRAAEEELESLAGSLPALVEA